ncbi:MAG: carboxypeptidase-like regulatory domain-containing protein [Thermofilaceae archaeon]
MRIIACLLLPLLAAVAVSAQPKLFVVEARALRLSGTEVKYYLLEFSDAPTLTLQVHPDAKEVVVRVDSSTPYKPYAVFFDGTRVTACYEDGVTLIEDFVWVNFTRLGWRPRTITVRFNYSEPKPHAYALSERGERVWGHLVEALCSDANVLEGLAGLKVTVLSKKLLSIQTSMGVVSLWDVVVLQTGGELDSLLEIVRRASVEVRVRTLYYSTAKPAQQPLYFYVNLPAACVERFNASLRARDIVGRAFPDNPALYAPQEATILGTCSVTVSNPGPFDYFIAGVYIPAGSKREVSIAPNGTLSADAYRGGVKVYTLTIYGLPGLLELPSYAYNVNVFVVDSGGRPASNATVIVSGTSNSIRVTCRLLNGVCSFQDIPPGAYIISAYVGGKEVGRTSLILERGDQVVNLRADLTDFDVVVLYPTGERMLGYVVLLQAYGLRYEARELQGRAAFNDVPSGLYNYWVVKDGVVVASGVLKVEPQRVSYAIIANVSKVHLKVVDFLGRPLPHVNVQVKGSVSVEGCTDERGVVTLDLPLGWYDVEVGAIGLRKRVNVRSGGEYFVLYADAPLHYIVTVVLVMVIASLALKVARGGREAEVEVYDLENN